MLHVYECVVRVRFDDDDVIEDMVDNDELTEEEAEDYAPTREDLDAYAWKMIEQDDGEYGSPYEID